MVSKHAMRYLRGTVEYGIKYDMNQRINLEGYVDSYWEGSAIDRKRTSRFHLLGYLGGSMFLLKTTI